MEEIAAREFPTPIIFVGAQFTFRSHDSTYDNAYKHVSIFGRPASATPRSQCLLAPAKRENLMTELINWHRSQDLSCLAFIFLHLCDKRLNRSEFFLGANPFDKEHLDRLAIKVTGILK
jgi:hypothetical protein